MLAMHVHAHHMLAMYDNCSTQEMTLHVSIDVNSYFKCIYTSFHNSSEASPRKALMIESHDYALKLQVQFKK